MSASGGSGREFTYAEVGASLRAFRGEAPLPSGYRHLRVESELGSGDTVFEVAAARLFSWDMHRGAGMRIPAGTPLAVPGVEVDLGFGLGPVRASARCRVIEIVDTADVRGFTYGTLPGHPASGEETFVVERTADGRVRGTVLAFSRPARWYTKLAGPVGHLLQQQIARRYLAALTA
ncbi:Uncharacterized protein, UPF0548 family [Rhodococcus rhodochrous J3]|uniref:Uncharacterized protein, UPF0548 family n=1 Tax=Rhodococcus rhodochrous J3 TaxID=903528 RepID=A0ABY1MC84_RHORH|nr:MULTISPECIES: DUF1990 domain-containing protein [Rhodococcus]AYA24928.1 DUF1990 domain-containing protein [Rhodococcus rhodochrous]MBF4477559.1 DUF1990 domain-containing protein [Rhodococcus rhodochrous]MCB8911011.1 DUF1990 domain-containing protein [Rhodococcus rhodochrous]MCD2097958.1 DUF1990 domain-containing protein [Rhodococcus rhodochrous]MCD2122084.1 DUF1990 domain-containing protein [Rhodococcus rhodochrous]